MWCMLYTEFYQCVHSMHCLICKLFPMESVPYSTDEIDPDQCIVRAKAMATCPAIAVVLIRSLLLIGPLGTNVREISKYRGCHTGNHINITAILFQHQCDSESHPIFLAATKQLYKWYFPSVGPSVCPSVCLSVTPFFTMFPSSYYHEIFRSYYHGQKWCPCKRSRSEVKGQGHRGQHPT